MQFTINIAMAEDHPIVRAGIISLINNFNGCDVIADAENGSELLDRISVLQTKPDLCILDISMPVLDGYATIVELKKRYPSMRFLVLTMFENEFSIIKMIKSGANGYILKRCNPSDLQEAIYDIYTYGHYYSNIASEKTFNVVKQSNVPKLSEKEQQFIRLCCTSLQYSQIAEHMYVSIRTLEDYKHTLNKKLKINSRIGLALFAMCTGLIPLS